MNNARMWTVVNPTVGLPLFFVGVAATSLIVHASIMNNSDFMGKFWAGQEMDSASLSIFDPAYDKAQSSTVAASLGSGEAFIVLPDGRTGRVVFDAPVTLASADGASPITVE